MGEAVLRQIDDDAHRQAIVGQFGALHDSLRRGCAERAARAVLEVAGG